MQCRAELPCAMHAVLRVPCCAVLSCMTLCCAVTHSQNLTAGESGLMETLDPEVRADVEAAAHVLAAHQPTPRER